MDRNTVLLAVKDSKGKVYTMPSKTDECIFEVHYCTSYIHFKIQQIVEKNGRKYYPLKNIFVVLGNANLIDLIALKDAEIGELVYVRREYENERN